MRTYDKRIGFIVSYQTLIPHGGIGQFTKSFCELMDEHNIKVDIITDKQPKDDDFVKNLKANIIYPIEALPYTTHTNIFMYGDTFCYERMANFRNAIIKALEHNTKRVALVNKETGVVENLIVIDPIEDQPYEGYIFVDLEKTAIPVNPEISELEKIIKERKFDFPEPRGGTLIKWGIENNGFTKDFLYRKSTTHSK